VVSTFIDHGNQASMLFLQASVVQLGSNMKIKQAELSWRWRRTIPINSSNQGEIGAIQSS